MWLSLAAGSLPKPGQTPDTATERLRPHAAWSGDQQSKRTILASPSASTSRVLCQDATSHALLPPLWRPFKLDSQILYTWTTGGLPPEYVHAMVGPRAWPQHQAIGHNLP
jgi:hypothetical protein